MRQQCDSWRRYFDNLWHYIQYKVALIHDGVEIDSDSCDGFQSDDEIYLHSIMRDAAACLLRKALKDYRRFRAMSPIKIVHIGGFPEFLEFLQNNCLDVGFKL
jgi:hypothetical protein